MKAFPDMGIEPVSVAAGDNSSAAISSTGALYTWGKNIMSGALGHDHVRGSKQPEKVKALNGIPIAM